jgi:transcriptional regulator with XRE-family HTH domain
MSSGIEHGSSSDKIHDVTRAAVTASTAGVPRSALELGGELGQQLRRRREHEGVSLRALSRRLAISPSALSQIETGKSRPSVRTLYAIVTELGMSLDELFAAAAGRDETATEPVDITPVQPRPSGEGRPPAAPRVQSRQTRSAIQLESGVRWERLTAHADPDADFLWVVYEPGGSSSQGDEFIRHSGREYGLILSGTLEVTVGFETHDLGPGDSISFESTTPHRLRNVGTVPVEGVWLVVGRGGDARDGFEFRGNSGSPGTPS